MSYRYRKPYSQDGKPAKWITEIPTGISGVYLIRDSETKALLYVGESHTGRLRKTLLRHFQKWDGKTAGETYDPSAVEVAITAAPKGEAVAEQNRLIEKLAPRDNDQGAPKPQSFISRFFSTIEPDPF